MLTVSSENVKQLFDNIFIYYLSWLRNNNTYFNFLVAIRGVTKIMCLGTCYEQCAHLLAN